MMIRYKLANKLQKKRSSISSDSRDVDRAQGLSRKICFPSPLLADSDSRNITMMQPKRISICSDSDREESSSSTVSSSEMMPILGGIHSPIPMAKPFVSPVQGTLLLKKPTSKPILPSGVCFTPIGASRRLDFDSVGKMTFAEGIAHSLSHQESAIVSPRLTPDSTARPSFEESIKREVLKPKHGTPYLPSSLSVPSNYEHQAVDILMGLREREVRILEDGPLTCTPPKRRLMSAEHAKQVFKSLGGVTEEDHLVTNTSDEDESLHPRKRRKYPVRASSSKIHTSSRSTRASAVCSIQDEDEDVSTEDLTSTISSGTNKRTGIRLAMPDDPQELNSLHCFVRSDLLEVFAMDEHSNKHKKGTPKVGFRCVHCGHLPRKEKEGASMSIFYPKSLQDIYRGVCTWQRIHFKACKHIPEHLVEKYDYLKEMDRTRGKKQHWINSAYKLGLRNLDNNRGGIVWDPQGEEVPL